MCALVLATKIVDSIIECYVLDVVILAAVFKVRRFWVRLEKGLLSPMDMDPSVVLLSLDLVEFLLELRTFVRRHLTMLQPEDLGYDVNVEDLF